MKKRNNLPLNYKERSNSRISLICSMAALVILVFIFNQIDYNMIRKPAKQAAEAAQREKEKADIEASTPKISTADVIAVGDNLYHGYLYQSGQSESGEWNYDHVYANVLDEIQAADVAMIDQETVLTNNHDAVSAYPSFATPTEVGDAIVKAGFNVIEAATNHVDDNGYEFMKQTFDFWKTKYPEIPVLGIHETQEDADTVKTLEVNGITIAFLDYTYGTNNSGAGEGKEFMIDIFDKTKVAAAIQKAKEISDCIIFVAHWGTEDDTEPNEYQKQWAAFLLDQGVDVVIGGHPHVLQPYGRLSDDKGNEMVIFYSLGNFVSGQQTFLELLGGMAKFTLEKTVVNGETSVRVLTPEVKPLVMHYNYDANEYGPYMLEDYTNALAEKHSAKYEFVEEFTVENLQKTFDEIMSVNVTPSTKTDMLNVSFDAYGNMVDNSTGNVLESGSNNSSEDDYNEDDYDEDGYDNYGYNDYDEDNYDEDDYDGYDGDYEDYE